MRESTTIRVATETRDGLRRLAEAEGETLDEALARLVRAERQRRMGEALAQADLDEDETAWLDLGLEAVNDNAGR